MNLSTEFELIKISHNWCQFQMTKTQKFYFKHSNCHIETAILLLNWIKIASIQLKMQLHREIKVLNIANCDRKKRIVRFAFQLNRQFMSTAFKLNCIDEVIANLTTFQRGESVNICWKAVNSSQEWQVFDVTVNRQHNKKSIFILQYKREERKKLVVYSELSLVCAVVLLICLQCARSIYILK